MSKLKNKLKNYRIGKYGLKNLKPLAEPLAEVARVRKEIETRVDDVLLDLRHKGFKLQDPQDMIQSVGRKVLERAENVRVELARQAKAPSWLKDVKIFANNSSESAQELVREFADKIRNRSKTARKTSARAQAKAAKSAAGKRKAKVSVAKPAAKSAVKSTVKPGPKHAKPATAKTRKAPKTKSTSASL